MKALFGAISVAALVVGVTQLAAERDTVEAARWTIEGVATGAEEVPAVTSPGSARVRVVYDDVARTLEFAVTVNGLSPDQVTAAHIHRGARGVNGPIVHNLSTVGFTQVSGTIQLSAADVADLRAGDFYVNVHSVQNPGGFARLQLVLPAAALAPPTPATGVTPPATGDAGLAAPGSAYLPHLALVLFLLTGAGALAFARRRA